MQQFNEFIEFRIQDHFLFFMHARNSAKFNGQKDTEFPNLELLKTDTVNTKCDSANDGGM